MWRRNLRVLVNFPKGLVSNYSASLVPGLGARLRRRGLPRQVPRERS